MMEKGELPLQLRREGFDPAEELARMRDEERVIEMKTPFGVSAYLVFRYDDVRQVLSDPFRFSSAQAGSLRSVPAGEEGFGDTRPGNLIAFDPPEHTRLRRMLAPEFTVPRMRKLEPRIADIVEAALDDVERTGPPADLVSHFALPVPSLVICELLGVPAADRDAFQDRSTRLIDMSLPREEHNAAAREDREYMAGLVARAQRQPGEDTLGMLVREHGDDLSSDELIGLASLLLLAGHETTSNMLALGTLALLKHPDQLAIIRDDPARIEPAIEELLRWLSIVQTLPPRMATTDVEIGGHAIPAGSLVMPTLPTANRDPALLEDPDTLDITRRAAAHVAFGHGVHHCIGAPLARREMRIAIPALLRRFPRLALADPDRAPDFRVFSAVYGLHSLRVTW